MGVFLCIKNLAKHAQLCSDLTPFQGTCFVRAIEFTWLISFHQNFKKQAWVFCVPELEQKEAVN